MKRDLSCIKDFRHALVEAIKTAKIDGISDRVACDREERFWPEEYAFCIVGIQNISFSDSRTSPRFYQMEATVYVDIYARGYSDEFNIPREGISSVSDFLDDTAQKIVAAVDPCADSKGPFEGLVKRCVLQSFERGLSEGSETERGAMRITFKAYGAVETWDMSAEDDFLTTENKLSVNDGDALMFNTKLRGKE